MLDEVEGVTIGLRRAGQQRLTPRFGVRIDDRAHEVGFEDRPGDLTPASARPTGFSGEPALQLTSQSDRDDRGDVGGGGHDVYSIHNVMTYRGADLRYTLRVSALGPRFPAGILPPLGIR